MKISFISTEIYPVPPIHGGAVEAWIENIATRLVDHDVSVFSIYDRALPIYERKNNVEYHRFKPGVVSKFMLCTYKLPFKKYTSIFYYFPYSLWCAWKVRRIKSDIIHIHNRPHFVWIIRLLNKKTKIVLHIHQVSAMTGRKLWTKRLIDSVSFFFGCSNFIIKELEQRFQIDENKLKCAYNGVDLRKFRPVWERKDARREIRDRLGVDGHIVILYIGRIVENKGVDLLLKAFRDIAGDKTNLQKLKLLIVGGRSYSDNTISPYIQGLFDLVSSVKDQTIFTGYICHDDIAKYYLAADLVVVPSQVEEGFGVITIESMASGIPVIANAKGGIPEIVTNKKTGVAVSLNTSDDVRREIGFFIENRASFREYVVKAREFVENKFSWEAIAKDLEKVYGSLISNA